ncbi:MarR family winged helix-turn-helix transcriptional regulator [Brevundimonas kwangchunensis]|uniref:MarR family winged helix-turn-helix transcriptional regulator n=1 Tax=Brevundimonas kwangchunensis TaxID=322163 RepID=A0ABN1GSD8_9CAUL
MEDASPCVCGRLRRASRALTRLYDEALEPVGLTVTQFSVMRTLSRHDRPTLAELAEATAHEKSALWRTLQPLARKGWIDAASSEGERGQRLALTPAGREKLNDAMPPWREAQARVSETLGPREAALIELLKEVEAHV